MAAFSWLLFGDEVADEDEDKGDADDVGEFEILADEDSACSIFFCCVGCTWTFTLELEFIDDEEDDDEKSPFLFDFLLFILFC